MTRDEILAALQGVFREVFDDATIEIAPETTADDVETADGIDDLIIDAPFAPPNDDGTDDPPENEE